MGDLAGRPSGGLAGPAGPGPGGPIHLEVAQHLRTRLLYGDPDRPKVTKRGAATEPTSGVVDVVNLDNLSVVLGAVLYVFDDQIEVSAEAADPFSSPGDSGSLVLTDAATRKEAIGLLSAGSTTGATSWSYANPFDRVIGSLPMTLLV